MLTRRSLLICLVCLASLIFQPAFSLQTIKSAPQALIQNPYADLAEPCKYAASLQCSMTPSNQFLARSC